MTKIRIIYYKSSSHNISFKLVVNWHRLCLLLNKIRHTHTLQTISRTCRFMNEKKNKICNLTLWFDHTKNLDRTQSCFGPVNRLVSALSDSRSKS